MTGVRGDLIARSFADAGLKRLAAGMAVETVVRDAVRRAVAAARSTLGPAASVRALVDGGATPLLEALGYEITARADQSEACVLEISANGRPVSVLVTPWGTATTGRRRDPLLPAIAVDARWSFAYDGAVLRVVDAHRAWTRQHLEVDLRVLADVPEALELCCGLLSASSLGGPAPLFDRAVDLSGRHRASLCRHLAAGVLSATGHLLRSVDRPSRWVRSVGTRPVAAFDQALTVLYRLLFLLFAEARGLVPVWHPIYRRRYTLESMVDALVGARPLPGLWDTLQAITRLARSGCSIDDLRVTAFNGRLFAPRQAPAAERTRLADPDLKQALLALATTTASGGTCLRIDYHDLDVEQLGTVYEQLLDYEPHRLAGRRGGPAVRLQRSGDRRKASGTFYTPRPVADWLVARALGPLVRDRPADEILTLRVLDPAMGSGAFLVAACRYLSEAAESARVRDGEWAVADVSEGDRIQLRRDVAQRCLYGVDLNATAVQLARLSLWLATMGRDKPLNFLDHHLVAGDSLVGATWNDVATRVPLRAARRMASLPLFDNDGFAQAAAAAVPIRLQMAVERDDNAATVRRKEALLDRLPAVEGAARWKTVFDLWCACWFWPDDRPPTAGVWGDLVDHVTRGQAALPAAALTAWLESSRHAAAAHTFLHWELVFPEVFFDERGQRRAEAGFDAVIGNPPWDVVRADSGEPALRADRRRAAAQLTRFARDAGVYRCRSTAHANRYQLFVDRALQLTRPGGRLGLVLPSGALTDSGASALRRLLFDRASVDELTGLDNRHGIFPIHRGLRFVLVSAEHGRPTERSRCRFGVSRLDDLPAGPSTAPGVNRSTALRASPGVVVTRALLERLSGPEDLAVPEVGSALDLAIVERISATVPRLDAPDGWGARFGRELHASDDRGAFVASGRRQLGRPVLEGKHIEPFRADLGRCSAALPVSSRQARRIPRRARLAYRDVAAATNRLTLIASVVPAHAVTTHTLHVLRTTMSVGSQQALCALLNSFVANYLVRLRVSSHLPAAMVAALRVPVPAGALLVRLATLADGLARSTGEIESTDGYAEIQARSARAFGVSRDELAHILDTFPLISATVRDRCLQRFGDLPPLDGEPRSSDHAKLRCR